jgi:hypothetical protein
LVIPESRQSQASSHRPAYQSCAEQSKAAKHAQRSTRPGTEQAYVVVSNIR